MNAEHDQLRRPFDRLVQDAGEWLAGDDGRGDGKRRVAGESLDAFLQDVFGSDL